MIRVHRAYANRAELELVSLLDLDDVPEAATLHEDARAARNNHAHRALEPRERRKVEVVEMAVRDEDGVDARERRAGHRSRPAQVDDGPGTKSPRIEAAVLA